MENLPGKIALILYEPMPSGQVTEDFYDACMEVNAKGVYFTPSKGGPLHG